MMSTSEISVDALAYLAQYKPSVLPERTWGEVDDATRTKIFSITPSLRTTPSTTITWKSIPWRLLLIRETHDDWSGYRGMICQMKFYFVFQLSEPR